MNAIHLPTEITDHFSVKFMNETIIKATNLNTYSNIALSNFDRHLHGISLSIFHLYINTKNTAFSSIVRTVKRSLSETLNHFIPFSGQFSMNSSGTTEILCNNKGVKLLEASVDKPLFELDIYNQNRTIGEIIRFPKDHLEYMLNVQITGFSCGGFMISWIFDHALADANAFTMFLSTWCEIARTTKCSTVYNLDRSIFEPRSSLRYKRPLMERNYTACSPKNVIMKPNNSATERHLYLVQASSLKMLKESCKKSRTVALSAHLWKLMARAYDDDLKSGTKCRMGWVVDGRKRIDMGKGLDNYIGNVVLMSTGECSIENLKVKPLEYIAEIASEAINEVANSECFMDWIDWVEANRSKMILPNIIMGDDKPSIVISSCHNMRVMDMDFGSGLPEMGVFSLFCSVLDELGAGYVNLVSSGRGDGSWFVSAMITSSLAKVLELDPEHIFVPIMSLGCLVPSNELSDGHVN